MSLLDLSGFVDAQVLVGCGAGRRPRSMLDPRDPKAYNSGACVPRRPSSQRRPRDKAVASLVD